jgi:hypothetical protein
MEYYRFNIGKPNAAHETNEWWAENLVRGVITAGFDGSVGDEGEKHLRALNEADWVLAYVSKKGFVGAGRILALETYKLHAFLPEGTLSDHRHERSVKWEYVIRDVEQAISEHEAGLYHPVSTCQRVTDVATAEHLIAMLHARGEHLAEPTSMLSITSADLVALLDSLDASIIITKNKRPESSWTGATSMASGQRALRSSRKGAGMFFITLYTSPSYGLVLLVDQYRTATADTPM